MFDAGLVMYVGLLGLAIWRSLSGWKFCGNTLQYANYCALLYMLLLVILIVSGQDFVITALKDKGKSAWSQFPLWIRPLVVCTPIAAVINFLLAIQQTSSHVQKIWKLINLRSDTLKDEEVRKVCLLRHDRAVQIIALPAVYGTMAMCSLVQLYQLVALGADSLNANSWLEVSATEVSHPAHRHLRLYNSSAPTPVGNYTGAKELVLQKSQTCIQVANLYEAWVLFQFGKLTLELITTSLHKDKESAAERDKEKAEALISAHTAVEEVTWLGVTLFLTVCSLQAGWSLYLLTFSNVESNWSSYQTYMSEFDAAGVVASAAAVYNVHVVESTFHHHLKGYNPTTKFVSIKILVSIAFFQQGIFYVLKAFDATLPGVMKNVVKRVPLLGDILNFDEVDFDIFYGALVVYECILVTILHWWAWGAEESWYQDPVFSEVGDDEEKRPLMANSST